jgi:hypothetical protein
MSLCCDADEEPCAAGAVGAKSRSVTGGSVILSDRAGSSALIPRLEPAVRSVIRVAVVDSVGSLRYTSPVTVDLSLT